VIEALKRAPQPASPRPTVPTAVAASLSLDTSRALVVVVVVVDCFVFVCVCCVSVSVCFCLVWFVLLMVRGFTVTDTEEDSDRLRGVLIAALEGQHTTNDNKRQYNRLTPVLLFLC
jgi:uncharacterized membrane protein